MNRTTFAALALSALLAACGGGGSSSNDPNQDAIDNQAALQAQQANAPAQTPAGPSSHLITIGTPNCAAPGACQ